MHDDCRACVIIPARDEELSLSRTLDALRNQNDIDGKSFEHEAYEVILLLNNCSDDSFSVAERYQSTYPAFQLSIAKRTLAIDEAHVGTARRLLMDTAYARMRDSTHACPAILSTDADTVVAPDWIARNLAALESGADVVGGVIHLNQEDLDTLKAQEPGTYLAYRRDRWLQTLVAQLESILDPDPADPWPRHLEHFGASLACTPTIYSLAGGLPPVKPLEDVAFIDALRKVGARIRHCPDTHIYTSARLNGRAEVGLSGQLRHWQRQAERGEPHIVDSATWIEHRFRTLASLKRLNASIRRSSLRAYPDRWRSRIATLHADRLPTARFLELLDCDALIEELFLSQHRHRFAEIDEVISTLTQVVLSLGNHVSTSKILV